MLPSFLRIFAGLALVISFSAPQWLSAAPYKLSAHRIQWSGSMPAKTHEGLLTPLSSEIEITVGGTIEKLEVVLDMMSIDVTDLSGKSKDKLTKHLKSEDFFYVEEYPTASFTLTEFEDGSLRGSLSIRGIEKEIDIPVTVSGDSESGYTLAGKFSFNRQDFEVNYQNGGFFGAAKDKLIRDLIDLDISLTVVPQ